MIKQISNYSVNTKNIVSIYPPKKYEGPQKKLGMTVIPEYRISPFSGKIYHTTNKQLWGALYNLNNINYAIIYDDPDTSSDIQKIVKYLFKNGLTVFYRPTENCRPEFTPEYQELTKEDNRYQRVMGTSGDDYIYQGSTYQTIHIEDYSPIPEITKAKLRRFITYYDLPYPQNEIEWYNTKQIIAFYIKNKIRTSIDHNRFYICPHCKELVERGFEDEHICYTVNSRKLTHMEYEINGGED